MQRVGKDHLEDFYKRMQDNIRRKLCCRCVARVRRFSGIMGLNRHMIRVAEKPWKKHCKWRKSIPALTKTFLAVETWNDYEEVLH